MDLAFAKDKNFVKKFLLITVIIIASGILFNLLGFLQVPAIQSISAILIVLSYGVLVVLGQLILININGENNTGGTVKVLAYVLNLLLMITPLLICLMGVLSAMMLFLFLTFVVDAATFGLVLCVVLLSLLLGFGIVLSVYCYLNLETTQMWKF